MLQLWQAEFCLGSHGLVNLGQILQRCRSYFFTGFLRKNIVFLVISILHFPILQLKIRHRINKVNERSNDIVKIKKPYNLPPRWPLFSPSPVIYHCHSAPLALTGSV